MVYDPALNQLVLYGGSSGPVEPPVAENKTWQLSGGLNPAWVEKLPTQRPLPLSSEGMAYDRTRQKVVVYGGDCSGIGCPPSGKSDETWLWNGTNWTETADGCANPTPGQRSSPALAWDGQRVVMFGGKGPGEVILGDMWYLGPGDSCWTPITQLPTNLWPRTRHRMAYNEVSGEVMMFGGTVQIGPVQQLTNETWFYTPSSGWFKCGDPNHPCGTTLPRARNGVGLAFGNDGGKMVMFGGGVGDEIGQKFNDTWTWSYGSGWVCRSTPNCEVAP